MTKPLLLTLAACLLACSLPTSALAKGKGAKGAAADPNAPAAPAGGGKGERKEEKNLFVKYDKNSNGVLDADEKDAVRADFAADPTTLKFLDKNSDGTLDDAEISVLKQHAKKKKK